MSLFTKLGNEIASPVDAGGNRRAVENVDFQRWMTEVERGFRAFVTGGGIIIQGAASLPSLLNYPSLTMAWVTDPDPSLSGIYQKQGASGAGSWVRLLDLPYSIIPFSNAGAGAADAIIATPLLPLPTTPGAALLTVNITAANTGNVTLNGKPLRTNSGNEIAAGGLTAGSLHAFLDLGSEYRLLSDQASAGIVSAAEAAADRAEAAAIEAASYDPTLRYRTPSLLFASTRGPAGEGAVWIGGNFAYREANAAATDHDFETAGGVKLYVVPNADGSIVDRQFGVICDGDWAGGGTDNTAALKAWAASTVSMTKRFTGVSKTTEEIKFNAGDIITGDGPNTGLDASAGLSGSGNAVCSASGQLVALPQLAIDASTGQQTVTFASAPDLKAGDVFCIYNPADYSFSAWRPSYRAGEWCRVHKITGNVVEIMHCLYGSYVASDVDLYRMDGPRTVAENFRILQPASVNVGLRLSLVDRPYFNNIGTGGSTYGAIELDRCVDIDANGGAFQAPYSGSDQYGLMISNCQGGEVHGAYYAGKHAILIGGGAAIGSVPTRALTIYCANLGANSVIANQDVHGNTEDITFIGGRYQNGGQISGKNHRFVGCTFYGRGNSGIALYAGELVSGDFTFDGCVFDSKVNPNASNRGVIDVQTTGASVGGSVQLHFRNSIIRVPGSSTYVVRAGINGMNYNLSIMFDNVYLYGGGVTEFMRLVKSAGSGNYGILRLKDIVGLPAGAAFVTIASGTPNVAAYQLPEQYGMATIAGATAAAEAGVSVAFRNPYPKAPHVVCNNDASTIGGDQYTTFPRSIVQSGFVATARTVDNGVFASTASGAVRWAARLDEVA